MYVFIEVRFPLYESAELYEYNIDENWVLVESSDGDMVFAYAEDGMTVLCPGESTTALMSTITMKHISNAEYAEIDNINISITGYAIDCEGYTTVPTEVWSEMKMMK